MPRTIISKYPGSIVAASSDDDSSVGATPIPAGKAYRITCFGGSLPLTGKVELQLRTQITPSVKWRTLRVIQGPGHGHYETFQPIEGDGTIAALRIVRTNDETAGQKINAWCEGFRR